ncbi:MAG: glycerol-3-phosphate dehydrogenase C-terminal domain-containing protein, partial [bacterium]|nr:glycerol-3-phosphate dehydrogenase C-terminal domain-containing protein [bacterium]
GIDLYAANRLVYRYGGRAYEVLDLSRDVPRYRNVTCSCDPILEAEIRYALRKEKAKSLEDLRRRTRLSLGPCQGLRCFAGAAQIISEELGWSVKETLEQIRSSVQQRWEQKRPVLGGVALQEEELMSESFFTGGRLNRV